MPKGRHKGFKQSKDFKKKVSISLKKYFLNHSHWNKGKHYKRGNKFIKNGYICIYIPEHPFCNVDGYIKEHRLVMEKHLGRYLKSEERIHHFNGIRTDNRFKNLRLFPNENEHQKFHNKHIRFKN